MSIKQSILLRARLAFLILLGIAFAIFVRIFILQWIEGQKWENLAKEQGLQFKISKATRGNIYTEDGILLATSIPLYKLSLDPTIVSDKVYRNNLDTLSKLLAVFFKDKTPLDYKIKINEAKRQNKKYLVLSPRAFTLQEKKILEKWPIIREGAFKGGAFFEKVDERTYPFKDLAMRTIGFINENNEGAGLEFTFNKELAGIDGKALYQKITGNDWKPVNSGSQIKSEPGMDIYTTLDINTQELAFRELKKAVLTHQANYGCAIVMEVKTGAIRAMVNLGKTKEGEYIENYNYAIGAQAADDPGSTFKLASVLALLEDSTTLSLNDSIETGGGTFRYYDRIMTDSKKGGWGKLTVQQCFEYSSNIGISKLISRHFSRKQEKYISYLKKFGLTDPLENFTFYGLKEPYIKSPQDPTWSGVTLPWMSVGYETRVSPLQLLMLYNAVANQGVLVQPLLVRKIQKADQTLKEFKSFINEKPVISKATLEKVLPMLKGVVERGTARNIRTKQYAIAGKTGTSQKLDRRGRYIKKYKTSFAGFFPADEPKYSMIVVIDEPQGEDQFGADVSAPVFRAIADQIYLKDVGIQAQTLPIRETSIFKTEIPVNESGYGEDFKKICDFLNIPSMPVQKDELVLPLPGRISVDWQERGVKPGQIPNLRGLTSRDALYLLENKALKVYFTGKGGRVKSQSLSPGSVLKKGDKIVLHLAEF